MLDVTLRGTLGLWDHRIFMGRIVEVFTGSSQLVSDTELGAHIERSLDSMVWRDTDEIYTRLDDSWGQRSYWRVGQYVVSSRRTHASYTSSSGDRLGCPESPELQSADQKGGRRLMSRFVGDKPQEQEGDERERAIPLQGTSHATLQGQGVSLTGTGVCIGQGQVYCIAGTAGTRWGSCTARATRGHWQQFLD
ncbi:hypothetical protein Tco_1499247 [Tanacetum coccineum]